MPVSDTCRENFDPLKLVRDGTHQAQRLIAALDPDYAPVSDRDVANGLMFAKHYSEFLNYYNTSNTVDGNWEPFFNSDPSVILATCAVQNVEFYKSVVQASFDFLNDIENDADIDGVRTHTSWLFSYAATFVQQMDAIQASLPAEISLRNNVRNVIFSKLANAFARLISYYKADLVLPVADRLILSTVPTDDDMGLVLLGASPVSFASVLSNGLSEYWITDANSDWTTFVNDIDAEASVYGDSSGTAFERANHASTHNLFSGVFDQILKSLSRLVIDAEVELQNTLTSYDKHEPHYALFLSFLQLLEHARETINTLTARHLDFYYRDILQLGERAAQPSVAHLLLEPAKNIESYEVAAGTRFKAKDSSGNEVFFANDT